MGPHECLARRIKGCPVRQTNASPRRNRGQPRLLARHLRGAICRADLLCLEGRGPQLAGHRMARRTDRHTLYRAQADRCGRTRDSASRPPWTGPDALFLSRGHVERRAARPALQVHAVQRLHERRCQREDVGSAGHRGLSRPEEGARELLRLVGRHALCRSRAASVWPVRGRRSESGLSRPGACGRLCRPQDTLPPRR